MHTDVNAFTHIIPPIYTLVVMVLVFVLSSGLATGSCDVVDESGNTSSTVSAVTSFVTESGMIFCKRNGLCDNYHNIAVTTPSVHLN